jgi:hypothetical protein
MGRWKHYYGYQVAERCGRTVLRVWKWSDRDGITWDVLQAIKNDVLGPDVRCVEFYPPAHELVYHVNNRWLWVLHEGELNFGLHR